jgi:hypothetical protein
VGARHVGSATSLRLSPGGRLTCVYPPPRPAPMSWRVCHEPRKPLKSVTHARTRKKRSHSDLLSVNFAIILYALSPGFAPKLVFVSGNRTHLLTEYERGRRGGRGGAGNRTTYSSKGRIMIDSLARVGST